MKIHHMARGVALAALVLGLVARPAQARNPHCSGGILYVTQGMRDKDKGDQEGYERQMRKAVMELEQCAGEDPNDAEALGYLGWAYAELDSAEKAGIAFARAIEGLTAKGDKKKGAWATSNRNSYWARSFNDGIEHIRVAQQAYPEFTKPPADEAETMLRAEAEKHYHQALQDLTRASLLRPGDGGTMRNLGSVHAFMGDYQEAVNVLQKGLELAPADSALRQSLKTVRVSYARSLVDSKKYDEAIAYFQDMAAAEPDNADNHLSIGEAYFARAQGQQGDARKADFRLAGDSYARAAELRPGDGDLAFNAALAYQNGGAWEKSEAQWRAALKQRADDPEALSSLAAVLAEQKKFVEAIKSAHGAVMLKPDNKILHRQLGGIYTKAGNNGKGTEELMVYLALHNGQPADDAAATAQAARAESAAGRALAGEGVPEQVMLWEADEGRFETWFYWAKKRAYTFKLGSLVTKSDWSAADLTVSAAAGGR